MINRGKGVLVMAHPDDEVIFGWPFFQDPLVDMDIVICSSDLTNPERQWCSHRKQTLSNICSKYKRKLECLDYNSEFYKDARSGKIREVEDNIVALFSKPEYRWVFTHNPMGEYGHSDHKLVFDCVLKNLYNKAMFYSDICLDLNGSWLTYEKKNSLAFKTVFYSNKIGEFDLDESFYNEAKQMYKDDGVWTWDDKYKISKCSLYKLYG